MNTQGAHILVVDDEIEIIRALSRSLIAHGYKVLIASNGEEALEVLTRHRPDLLLLDLMLPDISGLEVCRKVRARSSVPIIVLSVKGAERDKVQALDLGADDYVPKPFGMREVLARVRVALRHTAQGQAGTEPLVQIGPLQVDFALRRVQIHEQEVKLTPTEYDLLKVFLINRGKILTRPMLLTQLWGNEAHTKKHSLHVYVAQLRQKIEPEPEHPQFILTVPGVGYRFNDDID
ncbi:MAG TPA: response regulator transcription factor [Ktedonosporobacter sp.]|nr:response regulator transcription factor [Ktedonosporobacter sp.]